MVDNLLPAIMTLRKIGTFSISLAVLLLTFGCSNDVGPPFIENPLIWSVSPDSATMGDTIIITGENFNADVSLNRIAFSPCAFSHSSCSRFSVPTSATPTRLTGIVPDGALSGSVRVEDIDPSKAATPLGINYPPFPSNHLQFEVTLQPGDVGKAFFSGMSFTFSINSGAVSEDYMLILFNSAAPPERTSNYFYTVNTYDLVADSGGKIGGVEEDGNAGMGSYFALAHNGKRQRDFERRIRQEVRDLLEDAAAGLLPGEDRAKVFPESFRRSTPPQTASFNVVVDPMGSILDPANFTVVHADLKFSGNHTLLYVDLSTHQSCITDQEAADLGRSFDESIYDINRTNFGSESDINGDGRVAILLTPVVNEMTPDGNASGEGGFIAGFFMPTDLIPDYVNPAVTNGMEIFYTMVPDPGNEYGNEFLKEYALEVIRGTLAHEFQHMIIFNYRVLIYGFGYLATYVEELWLDEGLAHIAEGLNGHNTSNILRANLFLENPGNVTLIYGGDELDERGASFLFLRYLGDRFDNNIFSKIVQSKITGMSNVENAAGENFKELFANWSAACYLSGLGITGDARFNYSSINLRDDFKQLGVTEADFQTSGVDGNVKSMGPEYIMTTMPPASTLNLSIDCINTGRMNAVIIRLH